MSNIEIKGGLSLDRTVMATLERIPGLAKQALEDAGQKSGEKGAATLRATAPRRTGKSAAAWTVDKQKGVYTIHAKAPHYRIVHLLENGHRTVGTKGKRKTKAFKYVKPVELATITDYETRLEDSLMKKFREITS